VSAIAADLSRPPVVVHLSCSTLVSTGQVPTIVLQRGKERSLLRRHPWVFSGAIDRLRGRAEPGDTVAVTDAAGGFLAWAAYSPSSQIAARVWTFDESDAIDGAWIEQRIVAAAERRAGLRARTDGVRVVFAESDGLPGLIVDRYAGVAVIELTSAGAERWRREIASAVADLDGIESVYERSDVDVRDREGLAPRAGLVSGPEPPSLVEFGEDGQRFAADVRRGHKTGFYLDQRESRAAVRDLAAGRGVLNVFGYTGAFDVAAWRGGAAAVTTIDSSGPALSVAARHAEMNGCPASELVQADAFVELRRRRDRGEQFDLIVVDPPKLVHRAQHVTRAARAYKDLNWLAFRLLAPGGVLVTFSCSGLLPVDLHQKIVADAALDAGRDARIVGRLHQAGDHPVLLSFPEAQYLKGLVCEA
jgi:23S rRNA (cytosine1962-C5)-methyltransferase